MQACETAHRWAWILILDIIARYESSQIPALPVISYRHVPDLFETPGAERCVMLVLLDHTNPLIHRRFASLGSKTVVNGR